MRDTHVLVIALSALAVAGACSSSDESVGNAALGIAAFDVEEDGNTTSLIGRDADGNEVARLDLVHGKFTLSEAFKEDYPGLTEVDGRKLDIRVKGLAASYETAGYEPLLRMPGPPQGMEAMNLFLADPYVKGVLARWHLGYDTTPWVADDERGYAVSTTAGTTPTFYTNLPPSTQGYGLVRNYGGALNAGVCGEQAIASQAIKLIRTSPYAEQAITQCCANNTFSVKYCPTNVNAPSCDTGTGPAGDGIQSTAGCVKKTVACKGATNWGTNGNCRMFQPLESGIPAPFINACTDANASRSVAVGIVANSTNRVLGGAATVTKGTPGFACTSGDYSGNCATTTCDNAGVQPAFVVAPSAGHTLISKVWDGALNRLSVTLKIHDGGVCQAGAECMSGVCTNNLCAVFCSGGCSGQGHKCFDDEGFWYYSGMCCTNGQCRACEC